MLQKKSTLQEAFSAFEKKLSHFKDLPADSQLNIEKSDLEKRIDIRKEEFRNKVLSEYKKYTNPFGVLGKDSLEAKAIDNDEQNLICAYNLHKSIVEANENSGNQTTFIKEFTISSTLTQNSRYTQGEDFVYLISYLINIKGLKEYIPYFEYNNESYLLKFCSSKGFKYTRDQMEILEIINSIG